MCASAVVMLDTSCSEIVWRVLATHSIRQFLLHFPSCASPCAITFQLDSKILKFLIIQFPPLPCHLAPLRAKYSVQHPILEHSQTLPSCDRATSTSIKRTRGKIRVPYTSTTYSYTGNWNTKDSEGNDGRHSLNVTCLLFPSFTPFSSCPLPILKIGYIFKKIYITTFTLW